MPTAITQLFAADIDEIQHRVSMVWGGADGIMRGDGDDGIVVADSPPSLIVVMGTFRGYISNRFVRFATATDTEAIEAPTGGSPGDLRRIDLVQFSLDGRLNIKQGVEGGAPVAPEADAESIGRAHVYCRNGMTTVENVDDSVNGYIVNLEPYV